MEKAAKYIRHFADGTIAGIASILPGISGGLILVLCGCYERLIEDISDLRKKLVPEFWFLVFICSGLLFGMLACTFFLDWTLDKYNAQCMAFFFGLIVAQVPEVWKLSGYRKGDRISPSSVFALAVGLGIIVALMLSNNGGRAIDVNDHSIGNLIIFGLCGVVVAVSKVMPGISGSSLLIALGLFDVTISSIAHLEPYFLIPLLIGLVVGILGFSKVMNMLLKKYRVPTYMLILGLTVGSLLIIIQELLRMDLGTIEWISCTVLMILGVACSYAFTLYGKRSQEYSEEQNEN